MFYFDQESLVGGHLGGTVQANLMQWGLSRIVLSLDTDLGRLDQFCSSSSKSQTECNLRALAVYIQATLASGFGAATRCGVLADFRDSVVPLGSEI